MSRFEKKSSSTPILRRAVAVYAFAAVIGLSRCGGGEAEGRTAMFAQDERDLRGEGYACENCEQGWFGKPCEGCGFCPSCCRCFAERDAYYEGFQEWLDAGCPIRGEKL